MDQESKARTPFQDYLTALGDERAASLLDVPARTVQSWRRGERMPRPAQARRIVERAPTVSMDDIYAPRVAA